MTRSIQIVVHGDPQGKAFQRLMHGMERRGDCWVPALRPDRKGYVRCRVGPRMLFVHRVAYEVAKGPIAPGMTIDHLCRNPPCFNPEHLEQVTVAENIRRGTQGQHQAQKTHCPHGHPYSPSNTYVAPRGDRLCRTCQRAASRDFEANRRGRRKR